MPVFFSGCTAGPVWFLKLLSPSPSDLPGTSRVLCCFHQDSGNLSMSAAVRNNCDGETCRSASHVAYREASGGLWDVTGVFMADIDQLVLPSSEIAICVVVSGQVLGLHVGLDLAANGL